MRGWHVMSIRGKHLQNKYTVQSAYCVKWYRYKRQTQRFSPANFWSIRDSSEISWSRWWCRQWMSFWGLCVWKGDQLGPVIFYFTVLFKDGLVSSRWAVRQMAWWRCQFLIVRRNWPEWIRSQFFSNRWAIRQQKRNRDKRLSNHFCRDLCYRCRDIHRNDPDLQWSLHCYSRVSVGIRIHQFEMNQIKTLNRNWV